MPTLEINECVSCPFSDTSCYTKEHEYVGEDMFYIICTHDDQTNHEGFIAKIKNQYNHIYFNCPLNNKNNETNY